MDITNQISPSLTSKTHQYSFGLLDDNLIQDFTLENEKSKNIIKNKPPIPTKTIQQKLKQLEQFNRENNDPNAPCLANENFNMDENFIDNADATVETLHLNESDLKELNNEEFTFDVDDEDEDDDDEDSHKNHKQEQDLVIQKKPDETNSNKFNLIDQQETQFNDFLMDESSNILRNSIELRDVDSSSSSNTTTSQHFNYDKLDEINLKPDQNQNEIEARKSIYDDTQTSTNLNKEEEKEEDKLNRTATNDAGVDDENNDYLFKPSTNDQTQNNSILPEYRNQNVTMENDSLSTERINQLVMQSVERVKRLRIETAANDNYLSVFGGKDGVNDLNIDFEKGASNMGAFNKMTDRRDSQSTIKTINSNFKNLNDNDENENANTSILMSKTTNMSNLDSLLTTPYRSSFNLTETNVKENVDNQYLDIDKANDENRLTLNSFYFKPSNQNFSVSETPCFSKVKQMNHRNQKVEVEKNDFPFDENNLADESYRNNIFGTVKAVVQKNEATNPLVSNQNGFNMSFDDMEFKSGDEYIDQINKDEAENRKEFASNDLTVADTTSSNGSGDSLGSNEKWWNNPNVQQMSKLDLSNVSYLSNSISNNANELNTTNNSHNSSLKRHLHKADEAEESEHDKSKKLKQKIDVFDYFSKKSQLPEYLANRDVGVDFNSMKRPIVATDDQNEAHDKTICDDEQTKSKKEECQDEYMENDSDNITLSVSKSVDLPNGENFSFTFNSSETGDFIQKKLSSSSSKKKTPFQLSKMLPPQTSANKTKTSISLKTIGEELDRVQNRLATSSTENKVVNEPLLSSSLKISNTNPISMDETISSINSSDVTSMITSHKNKIENASSGGGINPKKVNLSSTTTSSVLTNTAATTTSTSSNSNKAKPNSGSLTSTPSKMIKSVSETSSFSTISTTTIDKTYKSTQDNTNQLFNQDSFISSIPERTNDSTLIGNHHHHHHHLSNKYKHKSSTHVNGQSKLKKQKNAEIQTSPDQHASSSSIMTTTTRSSSTESKISAHHNRHGDLNSMRRNTSQEETNSRASMSSISSTNELPSNSLTTQLSAINSLASLLTQGNNNNGNAPLIAIIQMPQMQKSCDDLQTTNKSQFESSRNSINHAQFMKLNQNLFVDTAMSANSSSAVTPTLTNSQIRSNLNNQSTTSQLKPSEVPEIEINTKEIDFGPIAEGCTSYNKILFKILNLNSFMHNSQNNFGYIQVEIEDSINWKIESVDLDDDRSYMSSKSSIYNNTFKILKQKFNDMMIKARFQRTLSLHMDKPNTNNNQMGDFQNEKHSNLKFDITSGYYELFVNLDTKELKFFKEILNAYDEQFDPCLIKAQMNIYYYTSTNAHDSSINSTSSTTANKKLIQMINLRYILGFAKLRTQANLNQIQFVVDEDGHNQSDPSQYNQLKKKASYFKDDIDQTMTSLCDLADSKSQLNKTFSVENFVPISNAGNINIDVDCYFAYEENGNTFKKVNALMFKNYELKLFDYNIYLEHKVKQKRCIKLYLSRVDKQSSNTLTYESNKTRLIVEVRPNGFIYELPINVLFKAKSNQNQNQKPLIRSISQSSFRESDKFSELCNQNSKKTDDIKLSASKSILYFGRTLMSSKNITLNNAQENGMVNEFTIGNSNDFAIRCQIVLIIKDSVSNELNENNKQPTKDKWPTNTACFKFFNEMKTISKLTFNEQMTSLTVTLEPKESLVLKVKFCAPSAISNTEQSTISGVVKMNIAGFTKRFNVHLVGFLREAFLDVQNASSLAHPISSNEENQLEQLLLFRNIKHLKYTTQLFKTNDSSLNKIYRKVLKLSNFSNTNCKCLVYPVLYDNKLNIELFSNESINSNEKCYELGVDSDGYVNMFKLLFDMNLNKFKIDDSKNNELAWFEFKPNGEYCIVLELTSTVIHKQQKSILTSTNQRVNSLNNLSLCLFWIEYDINAFCTNNFHQAISARSNSNSCNSNNFVDSFINKLLLNTSLFMNMHSNLSTSTYSLNESNASRINRISSVDTSFNNSISGGAKYNRFYKEDYLRLLRQAIKCTQISMDMQGGISNKLDPESLNFSSYTQLPDILFQPSIDSNDVSLKKDNSTLKESSTNTSISSSSICSSNYSQSGNDKPKMQKQNTPSNLIGINLNNNKENDSIMSMDSSELESNNDINIAQSNETWSLSTNSILIENFKAEKDIKSYSTKFLLKNNLLRKKLTFILKYQSAYLEIRPDKGELEPMERLELIIVPRKELLSRLPWYGNISVWCNKIQKDIRVTVCSSNNLAPPPFKNTLSKANSLSSSISSITSIPSIKSSSTPYIAASNKINNSCTSLEQGTIISEITQYTLDSLSLTPLLNASCTAGQGISYANHDDSFNKSSNKLSKTTSKNGQNENDITTCEGENYDETVIRILTVKDDAKIKFPPVCVTQRKSIEFELNNYKDTHVIWKAYSIAPAFIRPENDTNTMMKSQYSTFSITPQSGIIPGRQKQTIKIEFSPREAYGIFTQLWQLDTRADINDKSFKLPLATYNCKLVLTGKSIPLEQGNDDLKLSNRILKSKTNINESVGNNIPKNTLKTSISMSKVKDSKENKSLNNMSSTSSLITASLSASNSSLSTSTSGVVRKLCIKTDPILFEDTEANKTGKSFLMVHNKEEFDCEIRIMCIMEPFFCKHLNTKIQSKHYIKIPFEFRPKVAGDYTDKIVIKVDAYDAPLSCIIKGKCVKK